jgi:hypothetical protein
MPIEVIGLFPGPFTPSLRALCSHDRAAVEYATRQLEWEEVETDWRTINGKYVPIDRCMVATTAHHRIRALFIQAVHDCSTALEKMVCHCQASPTE